MIEMRLKRDKICKGSVRFKYEGADYGLTIYVPNAMLEKIGADANSTLIVTVSREE